VRRRLIMASVLVVLIFAVDIFTGGAVRNDLRFVLSPVMRVAGSIWRNVADNGYFLDRRSLEARIQQLQDQLSHMQQDEANFSVLKQQDEQLKSLVHLATDTPGITAPIVSSLHASPYGTFLVGAGKSDGIEKGDLVIAGGGFVIGRISDVGDRSALVTELFAPNTSIDAIIDNAQVVVEGRGGGNAHAKVPHGITVSVGDPVTAPSLRGKPIGIVGSAQSQVTSAYSDVYIGMPINLQSLQYVYIQK